MVDLILRIDDFVVGLENEGVPFNKILAELKQYVEISEELDGQ